MADQLLWRTAMGFTAFLRFLSDVTPDATPRGDIVWCFWSSSIIYTWVLITESGTVLAEATSV